MTTLIALPSRPKKPKKDCAACNPYWIALRVSTLQGVWADNYRLSGGDNRAETLLNQAFRLFTLPKKIQRL